MVKHPDIDQRERIGQSAGNSAVRVTGFRHARGVIMRENHGCGITGQGLAHDFPGVHGGPVNGSAKQGFVADNPVTVIQEQTDKKFVAQVAQAGLQEVSGIRRVAQRRATLQLLKMMSAAQLEGGAQAGKAGRPHAHHLADLAPIGGHQPPQPVKMLQQRPPKCYRAGAARAAAQEDCQQFGV